jgi:hypothetical protein
MLCPYCGNQIPNNSAFCTYCGKIVTSAAGGAMNGGGTAAIPRKKKRKGLIAFLVILIAILLAGIITGIVLIVTNITNNRFRVDFGGGDFGVVVPNNTSYINSDYYGVLGIDGGFYLGYMDVSTYGGTRSYSRNDIGIEKFRYDYEWYYYFGEYEDDMMNGYGVLFKRDPEDGDDGENDAYVLGRFVDGELVEQLNQFPAGYEVDVPLGKYFDYSGVKFKNVNKRYDISAWRVTRYDIMKYWKSSDIYIIDEHYYDNKGYFRS